MENSYSKTHYKNFEIYTFESVESTFDIAKSQDFLEKPIPLAIVADIQTRGRGRLGNVWHSEKGNLYTTISLPLDVPKALWGGLSFVVGVAVYDVLKNILPESVSIELKWPNDVLVNGAKICGVLLEATENKIHMGIGLNITNSPSISAYKTVSCTDLTNQELTVAMILEKILDRLKFWLDFWQENGLESIIPIWKNRAKGIGKIIQVKTKNGVQKGIFKDINDQGALCVQNADDTISIFYAGEVFFD